MKRQFIAVVLTLFSTSVFGQLSQEEIKWCFRNIKGTFVELEEKGYALTSKGDSILNEMLVDSCILKMDRGNVVLLKGNKVLTHDLSNSEPFVLFEKRSLITFDRLNNDDYHFQEFEYNQEGKLSKQTRYAANGTSPKEQVYRYDSDDKLVEESWFNGKRLIRQYKYEYDEEHLARKVFWESTFTIPYFSREQQCGKQYIDSIMYPRIEHKNEYDSLGNEVYYHFLNLPNDRYGLKRRRTYNEKNLLIFERREEGWAEDTEIKEWFSYDERGRLLLREVFFNNDGINPKQIMHYDSLGNRILYVKYNQNGEKRLSLSRKFALSNTHLLQEYMEDYEGLSGSFHVEIAYDDLDNITTWKVIDANLDTTLTLQLEYEYNQYGDWVEQVTFENGVPVFRRLRSFNHGDLENE